ncbi:Ig-like domain-containing protein [Streptomyces sp. NPDC052236]|uniref:L,D-transpeptidase n=1 Tax=Streptomyces sp. NPDC052236 TaxID=3365686 RepID=UPI0037CEF44E
MSRIRNAAIAAVGGTAVLTAALTACSGNESGGGSEKKSEMESTGVVAAPVAAKISVNLKGNQARAGEPVRVTLAAGKLKEVTVADTRGGRLTGRISADAKSWTSDRNAAPGTGYTVEAKAEHGGSLRAGITTAAADKVNKLTLAPGKNTTVGVAQPLSIVFDHPVKNRAAVEKQLKVTTSNNTVGSWGWLTDYSGKDRVDWRPKEYWKPGTTVKLNADLNGIDSGQDGGWFVRDYDTGFTVGRSQVVKVDLSSSSLKLVRDGREAASIPVSAGTPGGIQASWSGTSVVIAKEGTVRMNSETVGLGDAYDKMVAYSVRLTWSGMYAHAAPWNAAYFGKSNKSHGCIGMSTANASSLYGKLQVGDPFEITGKGSKGEPPQGNGYAEWNLSWSEWQSKSALR